MSEMRSIAFGSMPHVPIVCLDTEGRMTSHVSAEGDVCLVGKYGNDRGETADGIL